MHTLYVLHYNLKILSCFGGNNSNMGRAKKEDKSSCYTIFCAGVLAVRPGSGKKGRGVGRHGTRNITS